MPKGVYDLLFISYLILYESHVIYFCRQRLFHNEENEQYSYFYGNATVTGRMIWGS